MKMKNTYLISIYLKPEEEKSITLVWKQDFEPTLPEILRKTVMHCVDKKYTETLLDNPSKAIVRKSNENNSEEIASYQLNEDDLKNEFFEYLELAF